MARVGLGRGSWGRVFQPGFGSLRHAGLGVRAPSQSVTSTLLNAPEAIQTEEDPETPGPREPRPRPHRFACLQVNTASTQEAAVMLEACITTGSTSTNSECFLESSRLLWESWYETLPLKEEPELLSDCQPG
ncbi:60S ribosomal protein L27a isoform X3 [Peromyscus californicus insignis]|uniref:60S ribosomal protein L27a isoform X3 n=1 Tax=Peromyscus californicus insignis TaxID=564181 RepID=UPI0022A6D528|nr:60S ribosomal protein L27a isoform X3 [Peromyscus californicus insignis]